MTSEDDFRIQIAISLIESLIEPRIENDQNNCRFDDLSIAIEKGELALAAAIGEEISQSLRGTLIQLKKIQTR